VNRSYDPAVGVAIVGTGKRTSGGDWLAVAHHHATAFSDVPDCAVTAVVEPDSGRRRAFMRQFGVAHAFRSLSELADARPAVPVDLAVLVVPDALHVELADEALARGLHTLVEKPITPRLSDAQALFEHARRRQLGLWESSQRRYMTPGLKKAVRRIGTVQRGHFEWLRDSGTPHWRDFTRERRGAFADLGSHGIKQMLALVDYGEVALVNA
jgi:predicted dehydrogenase